MFDNVDHEILCKIWKSVDINSTEWFQLYLGGMNQVVEANDTSSYAGIINSSFFVILMICQPIWNVNYF